MRNAFALLGAISALGWILLMAASCSASVPEGAATHSNQNMVRSVRLYQVLGTVYERVVFEDGTECVSTSHGLSCNFYRQRGPE